MYPAESDPLPWNDTTKGQLPIRVDLRFTANQIGEFHQTVNNESAKFDGSKTLLSRQDVLSALLAHSISQADPSMPPVHRILTIVNVRAFEICICNVLNHDITQHRGMRFARNFASCNALAWTYSVPPTITTTDSVQQTVVALAKQIRHSVLRLRDPEYLNANIRRCGFLLREAASREMGQDFSPPPGQMVVNSTWR
jgi:hypothetical protein